MGAAIAWAVTGDPCAECGRAAYHAPACPASDASRAGRAWAGRVADNAPDADCYEPLPSVWGFRPSDCADEYDGNMVLARICNAAAAERWAEIVAMTADGDE